MAAKKSVKASGTIKRERKPIFDHASLSKEQLMDLEAASTALASFISVKAFLNSGTTTVAPKEITDSLNRNWSVFFRRIKASGILKSKRKEPTEAQKQFNAKKGTLLQAMNKAKKTSGEASKEFAAARDAFKKHMESSPKAQK